jgi:hypothetical protein
MLYVRVPAIHTKWLRLHFTRPADDHSDNLGNEL